VIDRPTFELINFGELEAKLHRQRRASRIAADGKAAGAAKPAATAVAEPFIDGSIRAGCFDQARVGEATGKLGASFLKFPTGREFGREFFESGRRAKCRVSNSPIESAGWRGIPGRTQVGNKSLPVAKSPRI
jgi:hypothetical protein